MNKKLISMKEATVKLGVSYEALRKRIARGRVKAFEVTCGKKKKLMFDPEELTP